MSKALGGQATTASSAASKLPDFKPYEGKKVTVRLEGNRRVTGILSGYDNFMNVTIKNAVEAASNLNGNQAQNINTCIIRGSAIQNVEATE